MYHSDVHRRHRSKKITSLDVRSGIAGCYREDDILRSCPERARALPFGQGSPVIKRQKDRTLYSEYFVCCGHHVRDAQSVLERIEGRYANQVHVQDG